jgi:transglutaminase-like putative cysteine protease
MNDADELQTCLAAGRYVDSAHPAVVAFARDAVREGDAREIAVALYYAVRDGIRYDPYRIDLQPEGLTASRCLANGYGFCITKAALLAAALRVHGIASRLGFADVRNHLTSERLRRTMGTDLFTFHGYTEVWLDERWVKATPAFNLSLCERAGTHALEFDGRSDSILQPFDVSGRRHMEYVRERGSFADVPREEIIRDWDETYPPSVEWKRDAGQADFESEVRRAGDR